MDPVTIAILAGTGLLKSELVDRPREDRQRRLAAETQRYSPWTGLQAGHIQEADPFGSAIQGGLQGAAFSQNVESNKLNNDLMKAQTSNLQARSPASKGIGMELQEEPSPIGMDYTKGGDWGYNPPRQWRR